MGLTIGGVSYDAYLERTTFTHVNVLNSLPDTLDFSLIPGAPKPTVGAEVVYTLADSTRLFGGVLLTAPETHRGLGAVGYACSCSDYRHRADRKTLNDRKTNITAGALIVYFFAKYAPEFDTSLVDTGGATIGSIRFKRNAKLTDMLDALAAQTGYVWDINPSKQVLWHAPGTSVAPLTLTDTSANFEDLTVEVNRDQLANRVIVKGGKYPSTTLTTEPFDGDGVRTNFRLSRIPYGTDQYVVFEDGFSSYNTTATWLETDVSNPSPPAGHTSADGYLFTTINQGSGLVESGYLQIVGGNATWGGVRSMSRSVFARGDGYRRFEVDVYAEDILGLGRFGLWDPSSTALAGEALGVFFNAGVIVPSVGGVAQTALATVNYTAGTWTRLRIIPKVTSGFDVYVQTGANFQTRTWALLYTTSSTANGGNLANYTFAVPFNHSFNGRADRAKIFNRLYNITLTVGGTAKTLGLLHVDEDAGVDALLGPYVDDVPALVFFPDTIPAAGTRNIVLTYYEAIPVQEGAQDAVSIATIAALEGNDGVYEKYIEDANLDSPALARARAQQELDQWANPVTSLTFKTRTSGCRAGQVISGTSLTLSGSGRTLTGDFLIQEVQTQSMGSGQYEFTITAGNRVKGLGEYHLDLLARGLRPDDTEDDQGVIEEMLFASDTLVFTDSFSIASGPVGPYLYAEDMQCEDGVGLGLETGECLETEESPATPARYGMSTYA